jgi:hypothetical protein
LPESGLLFDRYKPPKLRRMVCSCATVHTSFVGAADLPLEDVVPSELLGAGRAAGGQIPDCSNRLPA